MSHKQTILIADHEQNIRNVLSRELQPKYEVLLAKDGLEAARIYESHGAQIATILMDLHLPRLSGIALTEWVHHIRPELPIIVMSRAVEKAVTELPEDATIAVVRKPFRLSLLKKLLGEVLNQTPARARLQ